MSSSVAQLFPEPASPVRFVAETRLPTERGVLRVLAFRDDVDGTEPLALVVGEVRDAHQVLARVHDACLTSEVLGSLKCDCRHQLDLALDLCFEEGQGVVVYLQQEGRGIGLAAKIAAYAVQELGVDTVDANRVLGLPDDLRRYDGAAAILDHLGVASLRLMTNNPRKVALLEAEGVVISERVPHLASDHGQLAQAYVDAKVARMGHLLGAVKASA